MYGLMALSISSPSINTPSVKGTVTLDFNLIAPCNKKKPFAFRNIEYFCGFRSIWIVTYGNIACNRKLNTLCHHLDKILLPLAFLKDKLVYFEKLLEIPSSRLNLYFDFKESWKPFSRWLWNIFTLSLGPE